MAGGEWAARHFAFRDVLRANREQARAYEALKRRLAGAQVGATLGSVVSDSLAKSEFVERALAQAGFAWPTPEVPLEPAGVDRRS